jgi:hypothetical protein
MQKFTPDMFGLTGHGMRLRTIRGYDFGEVSSAMQKAIRRGETQYAGYWAVVHCPSGTMWNRHDGRLSDKKVTTAGATLSLVIVADHVEAVRRVVLPGRKVAGAIQGLRPWRMVAAVARPRRR